MIVRFQFRTIRSLLTVMWLWCVPVVLLCLCSGTILAQEKSDEITITLTTQEPADPSNTYVQDIIRIANKIPEHVNLFLSISDADAVLRRLENTPINEGLRAFYERSNGGLIWRHLAGRVGLSPEDMFEVLLSRQLVFTTRFELQGEKNKPEDQNPHGQSIKNDAKSSWTVLAETDQNDFRRILKGLDAQVIRWVGSTPIYRSPRESSLDMASPFGLTALAPRDSQVLLDEIIAGSFKSSLANDPDFLRSLTIGTGSIVFFTKHPQWKEKNEVVRQSSWFGLNVELTDSAATIRTMRYRPVRKGDEPLNPSVTVEPIDLAPLDFVNNGSLIVLVERFADTPAASLGSSSITAPFVSKKSAVLQYAGPTLFTVVSAKDPNLKNINDHREVVLQLKHIMQAGEQQLTIVWGVELKSPAEQGSVMMNELLLDGLSALKVCIDEPDRLNIPKSAARNPDKIQSVDLTLCAKNLLSALPANDRLQLYWGTVRHGDRAWWLCATDLDSFNEISQNLRNAQYRRADPRQSASGVVNGPAMASLLNSWQSVNDQTEDPIFSRLFYAEELLKAVPRINWVVNDNKNNITTTEIRADW